MSRIENPREAIKDDSTEIFCLSITCQYGLLTTAYSKQLIKVQIKKQDYELSKMIIHSPVVGIS